VLEQALIALRLGITDIAALQTAVLSNVRNFITWNPRADVYRSPELKKK
jgi:hypothetical protein